MNDPLIQQLQPLLPNDTPEMIAADLDVLRKKGMSDQDIIAQAQSKAQTATPQPSPQPTSAPATPQTTPNQPTVNSAPIPAVPGVRTEVTQSNMDKYSPEAREKLESSLHPGTRQYIGAAIAGIGSAMRGQGGSGTQDVINNFEKDKTDKMAEFERGRNDIKYTQDQQNLAEKSDPNSEVSGQYRMLAEKFTKKPVDPKMSATDIEKVLPIMKDAYDAEIRATAAKDAHNVALSEKDSQFYQREWDKIVKDTDITLASNRTPIGLVGKSTYNISRAMATLSKPTVTNVEAGNVMADVAAIYQGGSPTEFGMNEQKYNTMYGKIKGVLQTITGKPQDAMPDAIKARLLEVLNDMKTTNSALIKQHLNYVEKSKAKIIKNGNFGDEWKQIRDNLESGAYSPDTQQPEVSSVMTNTSKSGKPIESTDGGKTWYYKKI